MYEFVFGFVAGAFTSKIIAYRNSVKKDAMVQADDVVIKTTEPILIPNRRRIFVPGELKNFWGADS
jgi:hypothetical protein